NNNSNSDSNSDVPVSAPVKANVPVASAPSTPAEDTNTVKATNSYPLSTAEPNEEVPSEEVLSEEMSPIVTRSQFPSPNSSMTSLTSSQERHLNELADVLAEDESDHTQQSTLATEQSMESEPESTHTATSKFSVRTTRS
ncbi:hypothetical protein BGX28_002332, partial [Mortierella sp. GBA30]